MSMSAPLFFESRRVKPENRRRLKSPHTLAAQPGRSEQELRTVEEKHTQQLFQMGLGF